MAPAEFDRLIGNMDKWDYQANEWAHSMDVTRTFPWQRLPRAPDSTFQARLAWFPAKHRYGIVIRFADGPAGARQQVWERAYAVSDSGNFQTTRDKVVGGF